MRLRAALAFALLTTPALAIDLPARKPGLWELKMNLAGHNAAMPAFQNCIDAATDKEMMMQGGNARGQKCSKQDVQRAGDTITIDSVCDIGNGTTATSHAIVSGDFNSGYTVKVNSKREGGSAVPGMPGETNMTIEAKWLGACKADQKPGDMIMGNGMKINVRDAQKAGGAGAPGGMRK
jgi:hypothetical protein